MFEEVTGMYGVFPISPIFVGTAAHPALPSEPGKDFFTFPILTKWGKKIKALPPCLSNSQLLGTARQMTEEHHPAGAVTPQPLLGPAAFPPHFPGSPKKRVGAASQGVWGRKTHQCPAQPSAEGSSLRFLTKQMLRSINKHTNLLSSRIFGNRAPTKSRIHRLCCFVKCRGSSAPI